MVDKAIQEKKKNLNKILSELASASYKLDVDNRFDVSSLRNNIYNVKISQDIEYIERLYETYPGGKIVNSFNYIVGLEKDTFIKANYHSAEEFKQGIIDLVKDIYISPDTKVKSKEYLDKHLKPVIAYEKINLITMFRKENRNKETIKMVLFGNQERKGVLPAVLIYMLLVLFGFIFVYPLIYMLTYSFMSEADLMAANVNYVPTALDWGNYFEAYKVLDFTKAFFQTMLVSVVPALCQTVVCALTGWGIARFKFKGSKILMGLIIFTFIIPSALTMLPTVSLYAKMKITGSVLAYVLPALFGQGFKSAVFILIFYQTFKAIPKAIVEAAEIDGANTIKVFLNIGIPSAKSAILLTVLLSVVWYYNETVLASVFFGSSIITLPLGIESFQQAYIALHPGGGGEGAKSANEAVYMAGTILNILPLVVLYGFTQKYFIQGMDKAGITGE